ncbi:phosphatidylserine decarboxylase [Temperatibacter marinus]|uniref:Phosphatidylserine decarboxylase proenzyme n=2 Tax=Temperatibacter marinus TaxID=1456591 RepID=A0AA52EEF7_9PROT|nr:phosphatidylserine decarboxylase [Temperatibacter marinus]WND02158.1 phosphatidylserine decarboxylase [Temperatibacter marinus]
MKSYEVVMTPIHQEGHRWIAIFAAVSALLFLVGPTLGWIGLILTLWCVYFFRDPNRVVPKQEGILVSPADGTVCAITEAIPPKELDLGDEPMMRISVFLSVFNVHVNRVPAAGTIKKVVHINGHYLDAAVPEASEINERVVVSMETEDGATIVFNQVAGLVARRILCDLEDGDKVERGDRFGLIRFGSRNDIYLDKKYAPLVEIGQTMVGGETVIAAIQS